MLATLLTLSTLVSASILWDGRMNAYNSTSILSTWSWSNQVGPYQYYIHGSSPIDSYVNLSPEYTNPADSSSTKGLQITIDSSSHWNGQTMLRTELIPQTSAAINAGKVFYHFSVSHKSGNAPTMVHEHQICFFESHFTELKFGLNGNQLQWFADGQAFWNISFVADVWHNFAYGIDSDGGSVELYHSIEGKDLEMVAEPVDVDAVSDGKDWHLGVLRLPSTGGGDDDVREDWRFSGVWVEGGGEVTKVIGTSIGNTSMI